MSPTPVTPPPLNLSFEGSVVSSLIPRSVGQTLSYKDLSRLESTFLALPQEVRESWEFAAFLQAVGKAYLPLQHADQ